MEITIRQARPEDRDRVIWVESKSTPGLRYVAQVWDLFLNDAAGDWSVVELDGEVVACGKYTVLPDASAWLETLRVIPERQRLGIGNASTSTGWSWPVARACRRCVCTPG